MAEHDNNDKTVFGFWIYLMTDLLMFAVLFATFAVLRSRTFGGPSLSSLFSLPYALTQTLILLTSSFTAGLGMLSTRAGYRNQVVLWFSLTFALGASFLFLELAEFRNLVLEGHSWTSSAALSSYFALVGTHGLHIAAGLIWMGLLLAKILTSGLSSSLGRKLTLLGLFWHFLDLVWIFIFTVVYLWGAIL